MKIYTTTQCHGVQVATGRVSRRRRIGETPAHLLQEIRNLDKWELKRMQIAASMKRIKN